MWGLILFTYGVILLVVYVLSAGVGCVVLGPLFFAAGCCCIIATQTEKREFLFPYLAVACIFSIFLGVALIFYSVVICLSVFGDLVGSDKEKRDSLWQDAEKTFGINVTLAFVIVLLFFSPFLALQIYLGIVVFSYYLDLGDKRQPQPLHPQQLVYQKQYQKQQPLQEPCQPEEKP